jgi:hypothetical protein
MTALGIACLHEHMVPVPVRIRWPREDMDWCWRGRILMTTACTPDSPPSPSSQRVWTDRLLFIIRLAEVVASSTITSPRDDSSLGTIPYPRFFLRPYC